MICAKNYEKLSKFVKVKAKYCRSLIYGHGGLYTAVCT